MNLFSAFLDVSNVLRIQELWLLEMNHLVFPSVLVLADSLLHILSGGK